jgi:hypothetical protein
VTDWDQRLLCPDGACVGLIGDDGLCKVCGRAAPNWGDERKRGLDVDAEAPVDDDDLDDEDADEEYDDENEADDAELQPEAPAEIGEWKERKLCSDGACVGVIGDDGNCRVCGKAGE